MPDEPPGEAGSFCQPRWNQMRRSCQSSAMRTVPVASRATVPDPARRREAARPAPAAPVSSAPVAP